MKRIWYLLKFVLKSEAFGKVSEMKIDFSPDRGKVSFLQIGETNQIQHFYKVPELDWYPFFDGRNVYLIPKGEYETLTIRGEVGTEEERYALNRYAKNLCKSERLGATGMALTTNLFQILPDHLKDDKNIYYLADSKKYPNKIAYAVGKETRVTKDVCNFGVRPVVKLPDDIMVCWYGRPKGKLIIARMEDVAKIDKIIQKFS